jgi:hypothetical protein
MNRLVDTVQKRIGLLISLVGLAMVISNFSKRLLFGDFYYAVTGLTVWSVFLFTVPFIISIFVESGLLKKIQIFAFVAIGTLNIIDCLPGFSTALASFWQPGCSCVITVTLRSMQNSRTLPYCRSSPSSRSFLPTYTAPTTSMKASDYSQVSAPSCTPSSWLACW